MVRDASNHFPVLYIFIPKIWCGEGSNSVNSSGLKRLRDTRTQEKGQHDRAGIPSYLLHAGQGWDFTSSPEVKTVAVSFWDGVRSWRQVMPELLQDFEHDTIPFPHPFTVWAFSFSFCTEWGSWRAEALEQKNECTNNQPRVFRFAQ